MLFERHDPTGKRLGLSNLTICFRGQDFFARKPSVFGFGSAVHRLGWRARAELRFAKDFRANSEKSLQAQDLKSKNAPITTGDRGIWTFTSYGQVLSAR
jgi:hypothetical protein